MRFEEVHCNFANITPLPFTPVAIDEPRTIAVNKLDGFLQLSVEGEVELTQLFQVALLKYLTQPSHNGRMVMR